MFFATEKAFAGHMWTVGHIFCRPGISHLALYFIYESSVVSESVMRNAINQINFEVPVSIQLITTHFVSLFWKFRDQFIDNRQFWNITCVPMEHHRASQMFQARVQLHSQNSFMSGHSQEVSISSIFIKNNMKWDYNMSSMYKHTNRINHIDINRIFSVIYCSVGGRIGIFYFLPVPSIFVPK